MIEYMLERKLYPRDDFSRSCFNEKHRFPLVKGQNKAYRHVHLSRDTLSRRNLTNKSLKSSDSNMII